MDLTHHRIAVERSLLDAGLHPVGMEHFSAQPEEPQTFAPGPGFLPLKVLRSAR